MNTFVTIDFETAMLHHICAVGIVTVKEGIIIDEYYTLIQPPQNEYNWYTTRVHGITAEDTEDAPTFIEIYPEIKARLINKKVVAHNESFDRNVLKKTMCDYGLNYNELQLTDRWECTMKACKSDPSFPSGKLNECCQIANIELNHHEALSDAKACAKLYLRLNKG